MSRTKAQRERDRQARHALTFGLEAEAVRAAHCIAERETTEPDGRCRCVGRVGLVDFELMTVRDPAHIVSVGAGGGRFDIVALCSAHHGQQHKIGIDSFAELYGLDLRALADAQALEHEPPLGIRGLAARWVEVNLTTSTAGLSLAAAIGAQGAVLGYDLDALLSWVRRRMAAVSLAAVGAPDLARDNLVTDMLYTLGGEFEESSHGEDGPAWALCELAGWPS